MFFQLTLLGYVVGAVGSLCCVRRERWANGIAFGTAALASLSGVLAAVQFLASQAVSEPMRLGGFSSSIPGLVISARLDPLGAFFLLILSLLGLALSIYSLGYVRGFYGRKKVGIMGMFYNVLMLATSLVFTADNAFFFLVAWEIMALTAYCLVSYEHEKTEARNAGVIYFVMSHVGTGCLVLGFLLLFQAQLDLLGDLAATVAVFLMYGLTEAFRSTYLPPEEIDRRPDSIGKAIPNVEILVLRPDGTDRQTLMTFEGGCQSACVESVAWGNLADINQSVPGGGLLNDMFQPKPSFEKLQQMREKFSSWQKK